MKQLTNVEKKEKIAQDIKYYVEKINENIIWANKEAMGFNITFSQNNGMPPQNSHLCVFIHETVSY